MKRRTSLTPPQANFTLRRTLYASLVTFCPQNVLRLCWICPSGWVLAQIELSTTFIYLDTVALFYWKTTFFSLLGLFYPLTVFLVTNVHENMHVSHSELWSLNYLEQLHPSIRNSLFNVLNRLRLKLGSRKYSVHKDCAVAWEFLKLLTKRYIDIFYWYHDVFLVIFSLELRFSVQNQYLINTWTSLESIVSKVVFIALKKSRVLNKESQCPQNLTQLSMIALNVPNFHTFYHLATRMNTVDPLKNNLLTRLNAWVLTFGDSSQIWITQGL